MALGGVALHRHQRKTYGSRLLTVAFTVRANRIGVIIWKNP
jgi:hypothetical protein